MLFTVGIIPLAHKIKKKENDYLLGIIEVINLRPLFYAIQNVLQVVYRVIYCAGFLQPVTCIIDQSDVEVKQGCRLLSGCTTSISCGCLTGAKQYVRHTNWTVIISSHFEFSSRFICFKLFFIAEMPCPKIRGKLWILNWTLMYRLIAGSSFNLIPHHNELATLQLLVQHPH